MYEDVYCKLLGAIVQSMVLEKLLWGVFFEAMPLGPVGQAIAIRHLKLLKQLNEDRMKTIDLLIRKFE
jgi:hypothetical protein